MGDKTGIQWAAVPGYSGYEVSPDGQIRGPKGQVHRPMRAHRGHRYILARRPGVPRKLYVHKAVLLAFRGPPGLGEEARHLNGVAGDDRLGNLSWGTRLENARDKLRHGTQQRGERSGTAKLTEAQVVEIRGRVPQESLRRLAREFGVSHTAIRRAANGTKWGHVQEGAL